MGAYLHRVTGDLSRCETSRQELEYAIGQFVEESNQYRVPCDEDGLYNQTSRLFVERGLHGVGGDLWLALDDGKVAAFALTHLSTDVDDKSCFWITCAYVARPYRTTELFAESYAILEEEAKRRGAAHIVLPSSRSAKAYARKLPGFHPYVVLLKKDL